LKTKNAKGNFLTIKSTKAFLGIWGFGAEDFALLCIALLKAIDNLECSRQFLTTKNAKGNFFTIKSAKAFLGIRGFAGQGTRLGDPRNLAWEGFGFVLS